MRRTATFLLSATLAAALVAAPAAYADQHDHYGWRGDHHGWQGHPGQWDHRGWRGHEEHRHDDGGSGLAIAAGVLAAGLGIAALSGAFNAPPPPPAYIPPPVAYPPPAYAPGYAPAYPPPPPYYPYP